MNEKLDFKLISERAYNKRPLLTREQAQPWLDALRSNKYPQAKLRLRTDRGFCCLGVACEVENLVAHSHEDCDYFTYNNEYEFLPTDHPYCPVVGVRGTFHGFLLAAPTGPTYHSLTQLNDAGYSFHVIADVIEEYFVEPVQK